MSGRADVIVVGGGVNGCSIAYRLAEAGRKVLLLEQRGIASGASGRNGGMTGSGAPHPTPEGMAGYRIRVANTELMRHLPEELGVDFDLRLEGSLNVASTPEMYAEIDHAVRALEAAGLESDVKLLDAYETRQLMPALSESICGAEWAPDRGHLWPFALVHGFADAARRLGAEIRTGVTVERLVVEGDRAVGVIANGERIEADDVVLATNAYTPRILPDLPAGAIVPARGQILVTQQLPPVIPYPFGNNFDKEYGRQTPSGQVLCGGYRRLDVDEGLGHYEERTSPPVLAGIARCLTTLFPSIAQVKVVRCWAGIMGFTADGVPLIGRYDAVPGLTLAAGFNGGGFSWGPIVGVIIARILTGQEPGFDLAPFNPTRFHGGNTTWNNPYTAGERSNATGSVPVA
ncbi:MAG: FAD-binding oxidoreductase [Thermomicrobiales bacterium]|nr:FAD-binding oxidoreductase [Thermomicrobiales bacterium]